VSSPERGEVVLVRHGETEWTLSGQHSGRTDVPMTEAGRRQVAEVAPRLEGREFALVLSSPLSRAWETAELVGFGDRAERSDDLMEWDYGAYDGVTTADIRKDRPGWTVWADGVPDGETVEQVGARADRLLARAREAGGDVLLFSHGHFLRVLAARWVGLAPADGRLLALGPGSVSVLGWERENPVIVTWNG
jgi:broad specificity phosphatase PhoE